VPARVHLLFGDKDPVRAAGDRAHERKVAAAPAHHLDHERTLVRAGRGFELIDRLDDGVQGCVCTDRHVCAILVVVDGTGQPHDAQWRGVCGLLRRNDACRGQGLKMLFPFLVEQQPARE